MGFACSAGELNRFQSRYRLAKSFQGVALDTYTNTTVAGYSALLRIFLVWAAFEKLLEVLGVARETTDALVAPHDPRDIANAIRGVPDHQGFLQFVHGRANAIHQTHIERFLRDEPCDITYIASGIRHIFAHGTLTPHAGSASIDPAKAICDLLCEFLFRVMDEEFGNRVRAFAALAQPPN